MLVQLLQLVFGSDTPALMTGPICLLMLRSAIGGFETESTSKLCFLVAKEAELDIVRLIVGLLDLNVRF